jgi:hypothetical protein
MDAGIDNLKTGIAVSTSDNLNASVVTIQSWLGDEYSHFSFQIQSSFH